MASGGDDNKRGVQCTVKPAGSGNVHAWFPGTGLAGGVYCLAVGV